MPWQRPFRWSVLATAGALAQLVCLPLVSPLRASTYSVSSPCSNASPFHPAFRFDITTDPSVGTADAWAIATWDDPDSSVPGYFGLFGQTTAQSVHAFPFSHLQGFIWNLPEWIDGVLAGGFEVRKWSPDGEQLLGYSGPCGIAPRPPFCGAPSGWLGRRAYVIVGDVTPLGANLTPNDRACNNIDTDRAADLAAQRFAALGYTVFRLGSSGQFATLESVNIALHDPLSGAIWIAAHGEAASIESLRMHGQSFKVADEEWINYEDVSTLRRDMPRLLELDWLSCNAGFSPDIGGKWNVAPDGWHATQGIMTPASDIRFELNAACSQAPGVVRPCRDGAVVPGPAIESAPLQIFPMYLVGRDGVSGDDRFQTLGGDVLELAADGSGHASAGNPVLGLALGCGGLDPNASDWVFVGRYRLNPSDIIPGGEVQVASFLIEGIPPGGCQGTFTVDPGWGSAPDSLHLWRFDPDSVVQTPLVCGVDAPTHSIVANLERGGLYLVTVPTSLVDVPTSLPDGVVALHAWPLPAAGGPVHLRWEHIHGAGESRIVIHDLAGRMVRDLVVSGQTGTIDWDLRDSDGRAVRPGMYWVRAVDTHGSSSVRVVLLRP